MKINIIGLKRQVKNIEDVEKYLAQRIPRNIEENFFGERGLDRVRYFASLLDNPQEKIKIVHVAGTSGKGSTATILSYILQSLGLNIGLQVSPHLLDIRERCQINNELLVEDKFIKYFKKIIPAIEKMGQNDLGSPTYFEIITVLAFYIFWKERVDYAIIETGLGGTWDASNIIENKNKIAVLTKIGNDHTQILGKTLPEIANQKAGIIQKQNRVFSMGQVESVKKVIEKKCVLQESKLEYSNRECFFELNLNGEFQKENCALALKVSKFLSKRDRFEFNNVKIEQVLKTIKFPGRFEIKKIQNKTVIFDGAHNPQKMETFLISLRKKYPQKKFHFLIAFKKKKDYAKLLKQIVGTAENITITSIKSRQQDLGVERENLDKITKKLDEMDYTNYNVINGSREAFEKGLKIEKEKILVVTGSLYLISEIYKEIDL